MLNRIMPMSIEKFDGSLASFNAWKQRTQLCMKIMNIFYTVLSDFASCSEKIDQDQWAREEDICRDFLLLNLPDRLLFKYDKMQTAKEIWDTLNAEFSEHSEDFSNNYLMEKFTNFTFDARKKILPQVTDLEYLVSLLKHENIIIDETFVLGTIFNRLSTTWHEFKFNIIRSLSPFGLDDLKRFIWFEEEKKTKSAQIKLSKLKSKWIEPTSCDSQISDTPKQLSEVVMPSLNESSNFITMIGKGKTKNEWWLNSGVTCHVNNNSSLLFDLTYVKESVTVANGDTAEVLQTVTANLLLSSDQIENGGEKVDLDFDDDDQLFE